MIINILGILIAILAGMYVTSIHSSKTRESYIRSLNTDIEVGEDIYYLLIQKLLDKAQSIFGDITSQQSIILAITWALLYSSMVFLISWFMFGTQKIGNAEVTTIAIDPALRVPVGILFILSILLVILFFKSMLHEKIKRSINKSILNLYKNIALFVEKNISTYFSDVTSKKINIIINNWASTYKYRFFHQDANNHTDAITKIEKFKKDFLEKKTDRSILAIILKDNSNELILAGFNSNKEFHQVSATSHKEELIESLSSKPINKKRFIELSTSILKYDLTPSTIWGGFFAAIISALTFLAFGSIFVIGSWFFSSAVAISFYISVSLLFVIYLFKNGNEALSQLFVRGIILSLLVSLFLAINDNYSVLLFVFIFPLANGVFDWMSISLSRYFGQLILTKKETLYTFFLIVFDLIFAYIFLAGISMILAYSAEMANLSYGTQTTKPFSINEIITAFQTAPLSQGFWLLFMLFSTLIPTYIHLSVSSFHLMFLKTPQKIKSSIIKNLQGEGPYGLSILFFTTYRTISLTAPVLLLYLLFVLHIFSSDSIASSILLLVNFATNFAN